MLIILEGPDGSGKSHLARDLEELIRRALPSDTVEVRHAKVPTQHPLDEYERSLSWYRPGEGNHLILDRWHWGEYVYPSVLNRESKLDYQMMWHIENYLLRLGAVVVQCTQYADQYRRVYQERGNHLHEQAILPAVEHFYRNVRRRTHLPVVDYNWCSAVWGDQHRIIQVAEKSERNFAELNRFTTYVGPRNPKFLLLGDKRAVRRQGRDDAKPVLVGHEPNLDPAFMPFGDTSGHFLLGATLSGDEHGALFRCGLANACDVDDPEELWLALGQPRVVALGRNSVKRLSRIVRIGFDANHSWGAVPHPQYVRRFHHGDQWAYGQNIRMAARHGGDYSKWHAQLREEMAATSTSRSSRRSVGAASAASPATA